MKNIWLLTLFSLIAPNSVLRAQGSVIVVDGSQGPGANFADLAPAVAAANDGDILLVRGGAYNSFTLAGKGLSILADTGARVGIDGTVRVERTPAGQRVLLRGLETRILTNRGTMKSGLSLASNRGAVRVEDCQWTGRNGYHGGIIRSHPDGFDAVRVTDCNDVSFSRCTFRAGAGTSVYFSYQVAGDGGTGIFVRDSRVTMHHCSSQAAGGGGVLFESAIDGADGGRGGVLERGLLVSVSSSFRGGPGGGGGTDTASLACGEGGDGGTGFLLRAGELAEGDTWFQAGRGGPAFALFGCRYGAGGGRFSQQAGTRTFLPGGFPVDFQASAPWRAGTTTDLAFRGNPGDLVVLVASLDPGFVYLPAQSGVLLVGGAQASFAVIGSVPPSGPLITNISHPGMLPIGQGLTVYAQAAFLAPSATMVLGPASNSVLIGP